MRNEPVQYYIYIYISSTSTYKDVYYARSADATGRVPQADDGRTDSCISGYARLCTMTRLHRPTACHVRTGAAKPLDLISSACRIRHPRIIRHQKPSQVSMIRPPAHHRRYSAVILPDPETHRLPLGSLSVQLLYISFFFFFFFFFFCSLFLTPDLACSSFAPLDIRMPLRNVSQLLLLLCQYRS